MRANYTTKLKLDIKWQAWKLQAKWQMANDGEFKGQAKPESSPLSCQRSRSECNFYLLARSCGTGRAGGLRNADANLNYMHRALRTVRSHWKLAAQRIAPISVQAAPRDRRISWPICFVVGFLGHTQTRAHSGEDKDEDRGSRDYSGDQRDPQAAESPTATFALLCCPHTALYRECTSVCVWVSILEGITVWSCSLQIYDKECGSLYYYSSRELDR